MDKDSVISEIARSYDLPATQDKELNREWLASIINDLLNNNFQRLISILYRIDVNETKLRTLLAEHQDINAGTIIADLLIERQLQKIKTRSSFKSEGPIDENEKW